MRRAMTSSAVLFLLLPCLHARAQTSLPLATGQAEPLNKPQIISPLTQPTLSPGVIQLMELEGRFAQDVAKGGGKAFSSWFAEDAVTLNNGKPAVLGQRAIAANALWDPKTYQLTWVPQGAQMGPSGDTGFTWGHYDARALDKNGQPVTSSGRYITFWKKVADGSWKVALDASANDAPLEGDCCALPKP
jgi:ketosteroid isomerase-like protein